jgi:hypothetical protein
MVNELKALMLENVAAPPSEHLDPGALVSAGRRRVRRRRAAVAGAATTLMVTGALVITAVTGPHGAEHAGPASEPPAPNAPTLRLSDAEQAVKGRDYRVLASYTNKNLDRDNGQYLDGVTDDGVILFRDGPRADQLYPRFALMDPATGEKDWLPDLRIGQAQTWPIELGTDRLVLLGADGGLKAHLVAYVFDRGTRQWKHMEWPSLPSVDGGPRAAVGPDGRLYVSVAATQGRPPEGGWPTGPDGEADDAGADGDTYHLWSVSLTDAADVRDEALTVGDLAFTDTTMVWTDSTNGDPGMVHTRDLSTGDEHSFDPGTGKRCNLLSFGVTETRVVLGQYCGTYTGGVRDDRVQILTSDGDQVRTLQDSDMEGALTGSGRASDLITVTAYQGKQAGSYIYDLGTGHFLRLSDAVSKWQMGGPTSHGRFLWSTPTNQGHGATQWLGELVG